MSKVVDCPPVAPATQPRFPTRFREDAARNERLGKTLKRLAGLKELDEEFMTRLGEGMWRCDPVGAQLAIAMRDGDPRFVEEHGKVSMRQLHHLLAHGVDDDTHPALVEFYEAVTPEPEWVDWELLRRGQIVYRSWGSNAADALLQLSLIGGYRFAGPTELLVATGGLTGQAARRRMAETQLWTTDIATKGALDRHGRAWQMTLHVRAMHAVVNHTFTHNGRWDTERWGLPINETDQGGSLGVFDGAPLLGVRALGVPVSADDSRAVMHLWKYVGWLLGVHEDFLVDTEYERRALNYHVLQCQTGQSDAGRQLTRDLINLQEEVFTGPFAKLRGKYEKERVLSMLTLFLGIESMRELHLPVRLPWAFITANLTNLVRYRVLGRGAAGAERLERWGDWVVEDLLDRYFGAGERDLAKIRS